MSIWTKISEAVSRFAQSGPIAGALDAVVDFITGVPDNAERRQVAFTVAMISLSAKMAKADGIVTSDEITAFKDIFEIPDGEKRNVARMFNLAKQDVAGFDAYAGQIKRIYNDVPDTLEDILDGLFHIAKADGVIHENEIAFLEEVGRIFGFDEASFRSVKARHVIDQRNDPYLILGAEPDWSNDALRRHYRRLVAENHPDRLIARGVPAEFVKIANEKLAVINAAYDTLEKERGL
ncbi:MAG: DnaJ family molecular chaperone [Pseudomonadota bacterium]